MEQKTSVDISPKEIEDTSNSPTQKRAKRQPEENLPHIEATSIDAPKTDDNLMGSNHLINQQPTNSVDGDNQKPSKNGIFNFFSHRRGIVLWLLKRILSETPPVWGARELEEFGTSFWRSHTLLKLRKNHSLAI